MSALSEPSPAELDIEIALAEASNWQRTMIRGSESRPRGDGAIWWLGAIGWVVAGVVTVLWLLSS